MIPIITGSDGYIGTNLKQVFDKHEKPYVGLDRKSGPDLLSAEGRDLFEECVSTADVVIHLAAMPRIPPSWENTETYIRDNIQLTEYVARVCAEQGCHLIFASSSSVTGDGQGPLNPYSWTKKSAEEIIKIYGQDSLKYTIARIFTTYGNNGPLVIDKWIKQHNSNEPITLKGDGEQRRDFIHVEDVAEALYQLYLQKPQDATVDIGTGTNYSLNEISKYFGNIIERQDEPLGYAKETLANILETEKHLNWRARYTLRDWIKTVLNT